MFLLLSHDRTEVERKFRPSALSLNQSQHSSEVSFAELYCDWLKLESEGQNFRRMMVQR